MLRVKNRLLALAIAAEWEAQKQEILMTDMHLTTLSNTCIDNPLSHSKESLAEALLRFLETDTLCFRSTEPEKLVLLEQQLWDPLLQWFASRYEVHLSSTTGLLAAPVPEATQLVVRRELLSQPLEALVGLSLVSECLKSTILSLALMHRRVTPEEAVRVSRLETEYQASLWGRFASHEEEEMQLRARVAAATLFVYLHRDASVG